MIEPTPVTYRMIGRLDVVNPDAVVTCNCRWTAGHEAACDIVKANKLLVPPDHREAKP